jgi:quinoprotein glucose dehydrogenase
MPLRSISSIALLAVLPALIARADDDPRLKGYRVAPGYKLQIAATEPMVINPVAMTCGDDGRLFVIEWTPGEGPNDHIKVLTDTDGDGTFDKSAIYMDGLELPAGLLFWDGWTYITLGHDVVRFKDKDGDGKFEIRESIATGFGNDNSHHRVSGLTMGPDGWIYITTGDSDAHAKGSDGSTATVLRCGGVFRCKPDGSHMENVAFGMRNPFGNVAFDDEFHIFHTDNDNEGSPGFTGCRILHVVEGGDYGWRLREGARCCQPDFDRATWNGGRPGRLGWVTETGRGAPAGLCVLNSAAFPPSTRNLLVYPDVFRKTVRAYKLKESGATYAVDKEYELLGSDDGLFRPDDAEIGTDGALYILDWRTDSGGAGKLSGNNQFGRIYRLTWGGTEAEPARKSLPLDRFLKLAKADDEGLLKSLGDPDYGARRFATSELMRRQRTEELRNQFVRALPLLVKNAPVPACLHVMQVGTAIGTPGSDRYSSSFFALAGLDRAETQRLAWEVFGRYPRIPGSEAHTRVLRLIGSENVHKNAERAYVLAMGSFNYLPTQRHLPGELPKITASEFQRRIVRQVSMIDLIARSDLALTGREDAESLAKKDNLAADLSREKEILESLRKQLTAEVIARDLIDRSASRSTTDPFLRDAYTRALERLGQPGLDVILEAIKSSDKKQSEAARFALQGWRSTDGLAALMAEATTRDAIPSDARSGLFRALRELGPAVPPEPIVEWLQGQPKADAEPRAAAIRVLAAMGNRAAIQVMPLVPSLIADPEPAVRKAALGLATVVRSEPIKQALVKLIGTEGRPDEEKNLGLIALRGYEAKDLTPLLLAAMDGRRDSGLMGESLRTIAALDFRLAARKAESLLDNPDVGVRSVAIATLGQKPETALIVARRYADGKLPAEDLPRVL